MTDDVATRLAVMNSHVEALAARMQRFEFSCDSCRDNVNGKFDRMAQLVAELEGRLRRLEIRVAFFAGGAALVGTVAGALIGKLM